MGIISIMIYNMKEDQMKITLHECVGGNVRDTKKSGESIDIRFVSDSRKS